jgi:signal transduction histidine kinase
MKYRIKKPSIKQTNDLVHVDPIAITNEKLEDKERELNRMRDEFLSIASHELRTPLTAIRGNTSLIHQYYWDKLPSNDVKNMIDDIHESSVRLIDMVNDLLDTLKLEQRLLKFEFESFDITTAIKEVIDHFKESSVGHEVLIEMIVSQSHIPMVYADRGRTKQVLTSLVDNSLNFIDKNGKILIVPASENGFMRIQVNDNGAGIATSAQKHLFKRFEQAGDNILTRDSESGTGLGLYMSKLIMEQMHGSIRLDSSALGVGTTFSFTLPLSSHDH